MFASSGVPHQAFLQAAIVDLDGTMVDTLGDFAAALNRMLDELQLPAIAPAAIKHMVGRGSEHLIRQVLAHVGAAPSLYESAWLSYQRHYAVVNGRYSTLYPDVIEGLGLLRDAGLKLACITNKPTDFAQALLYFKNLRGFFDVVFGGDAFERKKPDPLPLRKACEALGSSPQRTLMIGDSVNDAVAARAAGCPVVLVTYGYNHGMPVRLVEADGFVDSLADLPSWLKQAYPAVRP
ncbi:MAG: phosphoglycolate phosphatase [Ramlibacter sp.]|nr:phosphoglycolate phosphatase [Ramlibacter sp.]